MAIIIPSKNIYSIQNPKIIDNAIDNVRVEETLVSKKNEYDVEIYRSSFDIDNPSRIYETEPSHSVSLKDSDANSVTYLARYSHYKTYYLDLSFSIPKLQKNKYVSKVLNDYDENGKWNVKYSVYGDVFTANSSALYKNVNGINTGTFANYTIEEFKKSEEGVLFDFPNGFPNSKYTGLSLTEYPEYYYMSGTIWIGWYEEILEGTNGGSQYSKYDIEMTGTAKDYRPSRLELTILGNIIGIEISNQTITYGTGEKPYSLNGNELLQHGTTSNSKPIGEDLSNKITDQYSQGNETVTLLCSIGEYKNNEGNIVISTKNNELPMAFNIGDIIEPYNFTFLGEQPLSLTTNNTPKNFIVKEVDFLYDGATWQKIIAQEIL